MGTKLENSVIFLQIASYFNLVLTFEIVKSELCFQDRVIIVTVRSPALTVRFFSLLGFSMVCVRKLLCGNFESKFSKLACKSLNKLTDRQNTYLNIKTQCECHEDIKNYYMYLHYKFG